MMEFKGLSVCLYLTCSYVFSLYMIPSSVRQKPRDDPVHIQHRLVATMISTLSSIYICYLNYHSWNFPSGVSFFSACGFRWDTVVTVVPLTCLLMSIFYLGPLVAFTLLTLLTRGYAIGYDGSLRERHHALTLWESYMELMNNLAHQHTRLIILRNIVLAPITEEIVFRALMIPPLASVYYFSADHSQPRGSPWVVICTCPLFFALAHVHHCWEKIRRGERWSQALIGTLVQATYTSIFGVIAAVLFMRTTSIFAPLTSHVICNCMGLPDLGFLTSPPPGVLRINNYFNNLFNLCDNTKKKKKHDTQLKNNNNNSDENEEEEDDDDDNSLNGIGLGTGDGDDNNMMGMGHQGLRSEYSSLFVYRYGLLFLHAAGLALFCLVLMPLTSWHAATSVYWNAGPRSHTNI